MEIRLISTDFDGTLVDFEPHQKRPDLFVEWIEGWQARGPGIWMLNTGRWIESVEERWATLKIGVRPLWVGCGERELYRLERGRYVSWEPWNRECQEAHDQLVVEMADALREVRRFLERDTGAKVVFERNVFAGAVAGDSEEADTVARYLEELEGVFPDFSFQRNDVYFRFCHKNYHKGACLNEVRRVLGVPAGAAFACGDHYNDLPMLRDSVAGRLACPSNAIAPVQEAVRAGNGYVASAPTTRGLVEALRYMTSGQG
jgi:hydroxymethylpyrimidine pyrophosphatase-like HAD family hydrolase